jgi:hypothetical protein
VPPPESSLLPQRLPRLHAWEAELSKLASATRPVAACAQLLGAVRLDLRVGGAAATFTSSASPPPADARQGGRAARAPTATHHVAAHAPCSRCHLRHRQIDASASTTRAGPAFVTRFSQRWNKREIGKRQEIEETYDKWAMFRSGNYFFDNFIFLTLNTGLRFKIDRD